MDTCSEDPHLGRASWLLGFTSLLLSVCGALTQSSRVHGSGVEDSGIPDSLKRTQGDSVLFHVITSPELPPGVELEKMFWGIALGSNWTAILQVIPGSDVPEWFNFQDKFEKRVHVPNTTTLRIDNLTLEDSGLYRARVSYSNGIQTDQDFHLTVYGIILRGRKPEHQGESAGESRSCDALHSQTGLHGQVTAALLRNILGSVAIVLLILGAWLYLWKTRGDGAPGWHSG
ncbi:uncharacterized protein LOC103672100 isoform X3 [Ursus maritimus]|uniref:Uncharacterized protein LOC103672100 isoform X3 n=1 Tax=Ursus maritimus TaxID=29073 RepID=A0A8M1GIY7_URSMA|nr:uncharacterized protein LOC103672100 isoform X3 [Ursus maritimus]